MADFYYLYDPADNLALGQAIHLANTDGGMSYIVPFAVKSGVVDPGDLASAGLGVIETAIAAGPLHTAGSDDPISNRLTPTEFQGKVSPAQWAAIKAMVKASINQAPPAGWSETSLEAADSTYSVISADAYNKTNQLQTHVFTAGAWKDADLGDRGNPFIALGGTVTDEAFIDYSGHHVKTPEFVGEIVIDGLEFNPGILYNSSGVPGVVIAATDKGDPVFGLSINAPGKNVTLANFSATSIGFGGKITTAADQLGFSGSGTNTASRSLGQPLHVYHGNLTIAGDFVVDQVTQVVHGTQPVKSAIGITGNSTITIDNARVFLGAIRGYKSFIDVSNGGSLQIKNSTVYGFSSSNSNAPLLPRDGLHWEGFDATTGSNAISHLIQADSGSVQLENTTLLREEYWQPSGAYSSVLGIGNNFVNKPYRWIDNDYRTISDGDLNVKNNGSLVISNSNLLGSITGSSGNITVRDSVVAGTPIGDITTGALVQITGGTVALQNSLIDSLDAQFIGPGSLQQSRDTHILATTTSQQVSRTTDPNYSLLATFASSSARQPLQGWADKDIAGNKALFEFQGPTGVAARPASVQRSLPVRLREDALPRLDNAGITTYSIAARFQDPVSGFDSTDIQTALGAAAITAGWRVPAAPVSRDGGINWSFQLTSPAGFSTPVSLQLEAGAANASLVTGLASDASNSFTLAPLGSSSGGGGSSSGGGGTSGGGSVSTPTTPGAGGSTSPGLDNDNLDESAQNNNGIVIDANKDGTPDANQSNVAGIHRVGDGTSPGDYAALAVAANYTLNAVTLLPITNNQVQVSLPSGGSVSTPIPSGVTALLEPLEFYVENVTPGATIEAELFIPDNFGQQTDAYMRFNYITKRFEEYVDVNGGKLYQLLDENADGKVDRVILSLTDGDPRWDGDSLANGVIIDPGSPIDAQQNYSGKNKKDTITGNLLANSINGKGGNDHLSGDLGRDLIKGGKGNDKITGGEQGDLLIGGRGRDHFIYTSAADSSAENPNQQDEIRRFHHQDRLDLRRFDGDTTKTGQQAFAFIGARSFSGTAGALRFHAGLLSADLDGDRTADFAVAIGGSLKASQLML
jgi:hypothetical protein